MMAPKMEARILQELAPKSTDRVLEVGTGSGYMAALLAHRAAHVHSVEILPELKRLRRSEPPRARASRNVTVEARRRGARLAEARALRRDRADRVDARCCPMRSSTQLAPGGRLFAVVGEPPVMEARLVTCVGRRARSTPWTCSRRSSRRSRTRSSATSSSSRRDVVAAAPIAPTWIRSRPDSCRRGSTIASRARRCCSTCASRGSSRSAACRTRVQRADERGAGARWTSSTPRRTRCVICHHGARSFQVAMFLERRGFARVHNLLGGVDAWAREVDPSMAVY